MAYVFTTSPRSSTTRGKKVYIFSSKGSISEELKTGGDKYFDLRNIDEIWGKDLQHRIDKNKATLS